MVGVVSDLSSLDSEETSSSGWVFTMGLLFGGYYYGGGGVIELVHVGGGNKR
jgi:hypothetical protein